jgi:hypothetical protein
MKFRLGETHYTKEGRLLHQGTLVGDDKECLFTFANWLAEGPTPDMIPLDDEAKRLFAKTWKLDPYGRPLRDDTGRLERP